MSTLEYIQALEEERTKIQVFQRELPLCLQLVTQAIEDCKQKLLGMENESNFVGQSECSEQTSTEGPVLEEFIPLKRASSPDDDEQQSQSLENIKKTSFKDSKNNEKAAESRKSDWLRSVQLWNQTPDPPPTRRDSPKRVAVMEVKRNGAFHPFKREKSVGTSSDGPLKPLVTESRPSAPAAAASSTAETGGSVGGCGKSRREEKENQSERKIRRCWSPELHKRFLQALQQLGGTNVATPKQIRELMKVDGLTNDEVKSHLQKYRLHNRRPTPSIHNHHPPQPQFVVLGGIWVPPPEYAAMTTTTSSGEANGGATSNGIYAPIGTLAAPPLEDATTSAKPKQQHHKLARSVGRDSHHGGGGGGVDSHDSLASSSSTDTTTT